MEPDKFEQAWQAQSSHTHVTINQDLLATEIQRSHQTFRSAIFRRDFLEVAVAIALIPVWIIMGKQIGLPWTWYLAIPALIWVGGFMLFDRIRHPQRPIEAGNSLLQGVEESLKQVEHQIWLLRNIFWWYLLPPTIPILAFFFHISWLKSDNWSVAVILFLSNALLLVVVFGVIYWVNQRAVRKDLEPRRQELLVLRSSLQSETPVLKE